MNIALLQPTTQGGDSFPPLGLGYIGTVLKNKNHNVKIIDLEVDRLSDEELLAVINNFDPKIIGITSTIRSKKESIRLGKILSKYCIIFGGPQSTLEPLSYLSNFSSFEKNKKNFFVMKGEAEISFVKFVDYFDGKLNIEDVTNLVYLKDGKIIENQMEEIIKDLDVIPIIDRSLFNNNKYSSRLYGKKATNLITSRGCPFRCTFCFHDFHGKIYRQRSAENIIKEIKYLKNDYGIEGFVIYDDNFTVDRNRLIKLCSYVIDNKMNIVWRCLSRVNTMDREILTLMKRAGCKEMAFGIESSSAKTLEKINKMISPEQCVNVMNLCREIGIVSKAYIMIGFPWETKEMMQDTIDYTCKIMPYYAQISVLTPLPDTEIYKQIVAMGYPIDNNFDFTRFDPCYETENFSKKDIVDMQRRGVAQFKKAQLRYVVKHPFSHFAYYMARENARIIFYKLKKLLAKFSFNKD